MRWSLVIALVALGPGCRHDGGAARAVEGGVAAPGADAAAGDDAGALVGTVDHGADDGADDDDADDGADDDAPPPPPAPLTGPCPTGAALEAIARWAWATPTAPKVEPRCIPAALGRPVWVVSGIARDIPGAPGEPAESSERHSAVIGLAQADAPGAVIADLAETGLSWRDVDYGALSSYEAHDLDGDGVDELLTTIESSEHGEAVTSLAITRLAGEELEVGDAIPIGYDDSAADADPPGPTSCSATVTVVPAPRTKGRRLIVVTAGAATGDRAVAKAQCPPRGVRRYAADGLVLRPAR